MVPPHLVDVLRARMGRAMTVSRLVVLTCLCVVWLSAADRTWDGGDVDDDNWSSPDNWVGDVAPSAGDNLIFSGTTRLTPNNDFAADTTFASITFDNTAGAFTIGGNRIVISSSITNNDADTQTLTLATSSSNYTVTGSSGNIVMSGALGGGTITKNGSHTLTLSGTADNNALGLTANAGTVFLVKTSSASVHALGSPGLTVAGATVRLGGTGGDQIYVNGPVAVNSGTFDLNGTSEGFSRLTGAGTVDNTGGGTVTMTVDGGSSGTFSGVIANSTGTLNLVKAGTSTLTLSGANTYSGTTTISAGMLTTSNSAALGSTAAGTTVASGATLNVNGTSLGNEPVTIAGTGVGGLGALVNNGADQANAVRNLTLSADATVGGTSRMDVRGGGSVFNGGTYTLTKIGNMQFSLVDASVTVGNVVVNAGTFSIEGTSTLGAGGTLTLADGTTLGLYNGNTGISRAITANGNSKISTLSAVSANACSISSAITINGTLTCEVYTNGTLTLSGVLSGAGGLTKTQSSRLTLSGTNTYSGSTTVTAGTLAFNTSANLDATGPLVLNGGTLYHVGQVILPNTFSVTASSTILSDDGDDLTLSGNSISGTAGTLLTLTTSGGDSANTHALIFAGSGFTYAGNITSGTWSRPKFDNASGTQTFSGVFSGTPGAGSQVIWRARAGGTTILSGANTYSGRTFVDHGTLRLTGGSAIPDTSAVEFSNAADAVLDLNGSSETVGSISGGTLPTITLGAGTLTTGGDNTATTFSGVISGTGGMVKTGTGTFTLAGTAANTYAGGTTISGGTLSLGNGTVGTERGDALGTGTVTVTTGGTLLMNPGSTTNSYSFANSFVLNGGTMICADGVQRLATGGGATLTIGAAGGTMQVAWEAKDFFIDGILAGSGALAMGPYGETAPGGGGVWIGNGANTYSGTITLSSTAVTNFSLLITNPNALQFASLALTSGGNPPLVWLANENATTTIAGLSGTGIVQSGWNAGTYTLNVNTSANATFAGVLRNNPEVLALTKSGTGTLTVSGQSTYTGGTTVARGDLVLAASGGGVSGPIGTGTITLNSAGNTARILLSGGQSISNALVMTTVSPGTGQGALQHTGSGVATWSGSITINADNTNGGHFHGGATAANALRFTGLLTTGGSLATVVQRAGFTIFAGSGGTVPQFSVTGTAQWGVANAFPAATVFLVSSSGSTLEPGTLDLNGFDQTMGGLTFRQMAGGHVTTGAGTITLGGDINMTFSGTLDPGVNTLSGNLDLGGATRTITVADSSASADLTISAVIANGSLIKAGNGTLLLSNASPSTYAGTTAVNAGTVRLTGALTGGGTMTVANGAALSGTGSTTGAVVIANGGTLRPGLVGTNIGTLTTGSLTTNATSLYEVDLDGTGPTNDRITSSGTVTCAGTLSVTSFANSSPGRTYVIASGTSVSGAFSGLAEGATFAQGNRTLRISYLGNQVTLTDAPTTRVWDGGDVDDNNWSSPDNWVGDVAPNSGDALVFSGNTRLTPTNDFTAGTSFSSITFDASAGAFTIGGNAIALTTGLTNDDADTQTLTLPISGSYTVGGSAGNLVLSGAVTDGTLTKSGSHQLTLSGTADNSGLALVATAGTVVLAKTSSNSVHAIGGGGMTVTGATVRLGGSGGDQIYVGAHVTLNAGGVFDLNALSEGVNGINGVGTVDNSGGGTPTLTIGGNGGSDSFSGVIANSTGTLSVVKVGAGTLTLSGASTYTGTTTLQAGTLRVGADVVASSNGPLGNAASAVILAGGTFESSTTTVSRPLSVIGAVTIAAHGVARTIASPITVPAGTLTASFVASSLRAVTQDDWRATQTITGTRTDGTITYNTDAFGTAGERAAYGIGGTDAGWDTFSVQWDGYLNVVTAGTTLSTRSDDGSRVWLDLNHNGAVDGGEWGSNGWGNGQGETTLAVHSGLAAGIYRMRVQYEDGTGGNRMHLLWNDFANSAGTVAGLAVVPAGMMVGLQVGSDGPDLTLSGVISGSGSVVKVGSAQVLLAGANTYSGPTVVTAGTLRNAAAGVLPDAGSVIVRSTGAWNLDGFAETVGSVQGAGPIALAAGALTAGGDNTSTTYSGVISGTGAVTKAGSGTWTLSGASTYSGLSTISAGTVQIDADVSTSSDGPFGNAASAIVLAGGTLASNTTVLSRAISVTGSGTSLVAVGSTRTVSAPIDVVPENGPLVASFVNTSLRAVTEDDWRVTRTISGTRADSRINQATNAFGSGAQRAAYGIGGSDGDWDNFSVQWDGYLRVVTPGTNLYTRSDDGSRVWLDLNDNGVVDGGEWGSNGWGSGQGATTRQVHGGLAVGTYRMRVQYEEGNGGNEVHLLWNDAANSAGAIDTQHLVPANFVGGFTVGSDGPDLVLTDVISGAGAVGKVGTCVVIMSGANTYAGETTVIAGTLRLGANDVLPATRVQVLSGAVFDVATYSDAVGSLAGSGSVTIGGAGLLTTGGDGSSTTYAGTITGAGALTKTGAGTFILTGINSYAGGTTVSGGVLQGSTASIQGDIVDDASVVFAQTTAGSYAGAFSGSGSLTKTGAGVLTLSGTGSHAGGTTVSAGGLSVTGNYGTATGAVDLASGTTLSGTGSLGGAVTIAGGATLAPGVASAATMTLTHTAGAALTLAAGSASQFTIGPVSDRVTAIGAGSTIVLGGDLTITLAPGATAGTYVLMSCTAGVSGSFSSVTLVPDYADAIIDTTTDPNEVRLVLTLDTDPVVIANTGAVVVPGATATITTAHLQVADAEQDATQVTYTLTVPPTAGVLKLNESALGTSATFTQDDIDNGLLVYEHGDLVTASDGFTFTISDGAGGAVPATAFAITTSGSSLTIGLVGYWPFDEAFAGSAYDRAGRGNSANLGTTAQTTGRNGGALDLDGSASDFATMTRPVQDDFTLLFWFKSTNTGSGSTTGQWPVGKGLLDTEVSGVSDDFGISFIGTNDVAAGVGNPDTTLVQNGSYNDDVWHQVSFARTRSTGALSLRLDHGTPVTGTGSTRSLNASATLHVGQIATGVNRFTGQIDDVRAFERVLNADELAALYAGGTRAKPVIGNLDGDALAYTENAAAVALDVGGDATVSDADDVLFAGGYLLVEHLSPTAALTLGIDTSGAIGVSGSTVSHGGDTIGAITSGSDGTVGRNLRIDFTTQHADATAVRDLIRALRFSDAQADLASRSVLITLHDGILAADVAIIDLTISAVEDGPALTINTGVTLAAGGHRTITSAMLTASDASYATNQITYTVTAVPAHGVLRNNLAAIALSGTFTQADIDGGLISYEHGTIASLSDSVTLSVASPGGSSAGHVVTLTATGLGLSTNLIGHWRLDESAVATTANDASGRRAHGTLTNMTGSEWTAGQVAGALDLDGTDDHVVVPTGIVLNNSSLTLATWTRRDGASVQMRMFGQGALTTNNGLHFGFNANNTIRFGFYGNDLDTVATYATTGTWTHWAGTYVLGGTRTIWRNGLPLVSNVSASPFGGSGTMYLGATVNAGSQFNGAMDEARIYTRALTAEELALLATTGGAAPVLANLAGDAAAVDEDAAAVAIDVGGDAAVSDADDLLFAGGFLLVENLTASSGATLSIANVGGITVSGATVSFSGNTIGTIDATVDGAAGRNLKVLFTTDDATPAAASALVHALRYADTLPSGVVSLRVSLTDGLYRSALAGVTVTVNTVNDEPVVATNSGLTVAQGQVVAVENTALRVTDEDNTTAQVTYTVTALPAHGHLRLDRVALALNGTFTQDDIDTLRLSYEHGTLAQAADSFTVTVADGAGGAIGPTVVTITVAGSGLATNLQARWALDDASGGTAVDASGNGNTGTLTNGTWSSGRLNGALTFAGNARVDAGNAVGLRPAAAISVSGWFNSNSPAWSSVLRHDGHFTALQTMGANAQVALWPGGVLQTYQFPWSGVWDDGAWHHYTATYDQASGVRVYFNGTLTHSTTAITGALGTGTGSPFVLGATEGGGEPYTGALDEVRVYDRRISAGEVRLLAEQAVPVIADLDGDAPAYTEDAAAIAIDVGPAASLSDNDDVTFAGGWLLVTNVSASSGATISIATTASVSTSGSTVSHNGDVIGTIDGTLDGTTGKHLRVDLTTVDADATALAALLQAIRYQDTVGPTGTRTLTVTVNDGLFTSNTATVSIALTAVNDAPVLAANTGITVASGKSVTITANALQVTDQDHSAAQVTYTVTATPANGYLRKDLVALAVSDTFTQDDIDNHRLSYEHGTLAQTSDGFTFTVSDGAGGTIGATAVTITVAGTGLANGLVAYWKFDESAGPTATDASGNGHDGTYVNGPTPGTGRLNGDLIFTRASQQDVSVPYHAQFALSTFTVSALINPTTTTDDNGILGTRTGGDYTFDLKWDATRIHGDIGDGATWLSNTVDITAGQGGTVTPGTWYLVTYVIDNAAQEARLYLDGSLRATIPFSGTPLFMSPGQTLTIGNCGGLPGIPGSEHANGRIDDVRVYNRALNGGEVQSLWQYSMPVIANLHGDAPAFTEGSSPIALDTGTVAVVSDADDLTFAGGWLLVENSTGTANDVLSVANIGSGAGQISVSGSAISYEGVVIGAIDGTDDGAAGADLRIGFTTNAATPTAVSALIQALRFGNSSETPSATSRVMLVTLHDNQFASSTATVTIAVSSVPDILSRVTVDADGDGHLDAIRLTFDQTLADDFSAITVTVAGYTAGTPVTGAVANDAIIEVPLTELGTGDTGATPAVRITVNTSLRGNDSNTLIPVEGSGTAATDAAAPVLLTVTWTDAGTAGVSAGDTVVLAFSESVTVASLALGHLGLPVTGDTLGSTTIADQSGTSISMTLAGTLQLTPGGAYSSAALTAGRPSGLFLATTSAITDAVALSPAVGNAADARDVTGTNTVAIAWITGTNPKTWALGSVALGHTANTASAALDLSLRNVGDSTVDLAIQVSASAPSGWLPAATAGTDEFLLKVDNAGLPAGDPTDPAAYELTLTTTGQSLIDNLLSGVATDLELFIGLPTAITSGGGIQQTTTVTITATLPP